MSRQGHLLPYSGLRLGRQRAGRTPHRATGPCSRVPTQVLIIRVAKCEIGGANGQRNAANGQQRK
jgi:hypothetical protein